MFKTPHYYIENCIILSPKEQEKIFYEYQNTGDKELLNKLVLSQIRLAYDLVDKMGCKSHEDDLRSEAHMGILYAISYWDPTRGRLSTLTTQVVRQKLIKYLAENKTVIRLPVTARHFMKDRGDEELENMPAYQIRRLSQIKAVDGMQYIHELDGDDEDTNQLCAYDNYEVEELINTSLHRLDLLDTKSRSLICDCMGIGTERKKISAIAKKKKLKPETVRYKISAAVKKLREMGTCRYCGKKFYPTENHKYYCCDECEMLDYSIKKARFTKCAQCGIIFVKNDNFRKFCGNCKEIN